MMTSIKINRISDESFCLEYITNKISSISEEKGLVVRFMDEAIDAMMSQKIKMSVNIEKTEKTVTITTGDYEKD